MPGTQPSHRLKIKPPGSEHWIDIRPLWQKASGDFSGKSDLPNSLENVPAIIVKADRPNQKAQPAPQHKPAA